MTTISLRAARKLKLTGSQAVPERERIAGHNASLRDLLVESDEWLSPQAAVLSPAATFRIAQAIVEEDGAYPRTLAAGRAALGVLMDGVSEGMLKLPPRERQWLGRIDRELSEMPADEDRLIQEFTDMHAARFDPASYGLSEPCRIPSSTPLAAQEV